MVPVGFNPIEDVHASSVVRYPQYWRYREEDDIYIDVKDKHAWVKAETVERLRAHCLQEALAGVDGTAPQRTAPPAAKVNSLEGNGQ